ncbi:AIPR family protein [Geomonas propionica]|uniref:AIPR family protein n=1 Tax=Geomonas propionica TaxID=2798582 RepID=A0ABS0YP15_9BACT|nr:AIPR family protein [Geomonas propionica]MBJ6799724.1 AIPR family protein [Geomonas propionica]
MPFPQIFEDWIAYRVDDGCTRIFRADSGDVAPHRITLEGGYLRLYVWAPEAYLPLDTLGELNSFITAIVDCDKGGGALVKSVLGALDAEVREPTDPDDEIQEGDERPRITLEIVSPLQLDRKKRAAMEDGIQEQLTLLAGKNLVTVVNYHWVDAVQEDFKPIRCKVHSPEVYTTSESEVTCSLKFVVVKFGDLYHDLTRRAGEALYASNVRGFLGSSITNKRLRSAYQKIIEGGESSQDFELFPFKNNGITISCTGIGVQNNQILVKCPQVVNGQQTIRTWEKVYNQHTEYNKPLLEKIPVVVKFVQLPNESLVRQVAFANNRQNPVSADILRSNEPVLVRIEFRWNDCIASTGLPRFFRKADGGNKFVTPKKLFQINYYMRHGKRVSQREIDNFFDDDITFQTFFSKIEAKILGQAGYVIKLAQLIEFYNFITVNNKNTNPERKVVINTAFGLDGREKTVKHPFFAVGKPGWNLCVSLFLQTIFKEITLEEDLQGHAERAKQRLNGLANQIREELISFSEAPEFSEEYDKPQDKHPDIWDEWFNRGDRYRQYLGHQPKGII